MNLFQIILTISQRRFLNVFLWSVHAVGQRGNQQVLRSNDPLGEALQGGSEVTASRRGNVESLFWAENHGKIIGKP